MSVWCVVNTLPHNEGRAEANLRRQGFRAWLPLMKRSRRHARRLDTVKVPVFPGYLFVELDLEGEPWSRINSSFGVKRLLCDGLRPQVLQERFVAALRRTMDADGTCGLAPLDLKPGTRVKIAAGPFADHLAVVSNLAPGDRIRVLLDVLGAAVLTTVPRQTLVPAA